MFIPVGFTKEVEEKHYATLIYDLLNRKSYKGKGDLIRDLSGNGYDLVLVNDPQTSRSRFGAHINFDGTNDYGYIKNLNYGGGKTISELTVIAWVRTTYDDGTTNSWTNNNWAILDFDRSEVFDVAINGGGEIQFNGRSSNDGNIGTTGYYDILGNKKVNDGEWHHIAVTFSVKNQQIIFYVDGEFDKIYNTTGLMTALGIGVTRYGAVGDGSEMSTENGTPNGIYYEGDLAYLAFYDNEAFDGFEIRKNYNITKRRLRISKVAAKFDPQTTVNPVLNTSIGTATSGYAFELNTKDSGSFRSDYSNLWFDTKGESLLNHASLAYTVNDFTNKNLGFNGSTSHATMADDNLINLTSYTRKTLSIWVKPERIPDGLEEIIYEQGGTSNGLAIYLYSGSIWTGMWSDSTSWADYTHTGYDGVYHSASISTGDWHHIFIGIQPSGSVYRVDSYLDAQLIGSTEVPSNLSQHSGDVGIGFNKDGGRSYPSNNWSGSLDRHFSGSINYIRSTNIGFTPGDITEEFNEYSGIYRG